MSLHKAMLTHINPIFLLGVILSKGYSLFQAVPSLRDNLLCRSWVISQPTKEHCSRDISLEQVALNLHPDKLTHSNGK